MYVFSGKYFICNVFVALQRKPSLQFFLLLFTQKKSLQKKEDNCKQTIREQGEDDIF